MSNNTETSVIDEALFNAIKTLLVENERLFMKLHDTGVRYESIDFDESGLYEEEEETTLRHWDTLSQKIIRSLDDNIETHTIKRIGKQTPDTYMLSFEISDDETSYKLHVNYKNKNELVIT